MGSETHAQANVQTDVEFGKREIRNALQRSLDNAEVTNLPNNDIEFEQGTKCMKLSEFTYQVMIVVWLPIYQLRLSIYEVATDPISVIFIQSFFMQVNMHDSLYSLGLRLAWQL